MVAQMNTDVQLRIEKAVDVKATIYNYLNTVGSELVGDSYSTSKEFFEVTYIPMIDNMINTYNYFVAKINRFVPVFNQYVPNPGGFQLDTDILGAHIDRLQREIVHLGNMIDGYYYAMATEPATRFSAPPDYYWEIYQLELQRTNCRNLVVKMEAVIQGIVNFNTSFAGEISEVIAQVEAFEGLLASLESVAWNTTTQTFEVPGNLAQLMVDFEYERMRTANGAVDEGYIRFLMGADSITGSPARVEYVYEALERLLLEMDDVEKTIFFNASFQISNNNSYTPSDIYENEPQSCTIRLSPVFIELESRMANKLIVRPVNASAENAEYYEKLWATTNMLSAIVMLEADGRVVSAINNGSLPNVLTITTHNEYDISITYARNYDSGASIITISPYVRGLGMKRHTDNVGRIILKQLDKDVGDETIVALANEGINVLLGPILAPAISVATVAVDARSQNRSLVAISNLYDFGDRAMACGYEGQITTVGMNVVIVTPYMTVNRETMAVNFLAYNQSRETELNLSAISISDLGDPAEMNRFVRFYMSENDDIMAYVELLDGQNPIDLLSEEDRQFLERTDSELLGVFES